MIEIKQIVQENIKLYDSDNNLIGVIDNVMTFYDVRVQIKHKDLTGYYLIRENGERINIDSKGNLDNYGNLYNELETYLIKLAHL